jgi:hypothetical protein
MFTTYLAIAGNIETGENQITSGETSQIKLILLQEQN